MTKHKYTLILIAFFAFFTLSLEAQIYKVDTSEISFDNKLRPCYSVNVDPNPKTLKNDWGKYLKKKYGIRVRGTSFFSSSDLLKAEDVVINPISKKRMDLYARITKTGDGSEIKVFAAFGYDFFVGDEGFQTEFDALKDILTNFLTKSLNDYYTDEIKKVNKGIKSLNKQQVSLLRSIEKNNNKMFEAQKEIPDSYVTTKGATTEKSIAEVEKTNKLTETVNKLDNQNRESKLKVEDIKEQLEKGMSQLEILKEKQRNVNQKTTNEKNN